MTPLLSLTPQPLSALQWLSLLHPLLMVLFVYPVIGATIRIGIHVRERRLGQYPLPASVGPEHLDHGRWLTTAMVLAVLLALGWSFLHAGAWGTGAIGTVPGANWPNRPLALALAAGPSRWPLAARASQNGFRSTRPPCWPTLGEAWPWGLDWWSCCCPC